jgi:hypothetical protein
MIGIVSEGSDLRVVLDAVPSAVFIADAAGRILDANHAALQMVGVPEGLPGRNLCGDLLRCVHARESIDRCGTTKFCRDCGIRQALNAAVNGHTATRRLAHMYLQPGDQVQETWFFVTVSPLTLAAQAVYLVILEDVSELVQLRQLVPMCANCRKVRDDADYWHGVETYLYKYTALRFTHGLCPDCLRDLYGDVLGLTSGPPTGGGCESP